MTFKKLVESSLSRVWAQTKKFDAGTISAFRSARDCNDGDNYSLADNKKNSSILKAKLLKAGYGVTAIDGVYIENYNTPKAIEVKEESYLVVDLKNTGNLKKDLIEFGKEFEQDSIAYQNAKTNEYYLISSNTCPNGYPGNGTIGVEIKLGKPIFGKDGEFHSKVNGRPFVFTEIKNDVKCLTDFLPTEIRSIIALAESEVI